MSTRMTEGIAMAEIVGSAMAFCAEKTGLPSKEAVAEATRSGDCTVCSRLHDGIARAVSMFLGSVDNEVQAVYAYDPERATAVDDAPVGRGINLIVRVRRKSAALWSLIGLLISALAQERQRLACPQAHALCWSLDVQVVDEREVRNRIGYGALVDSLYVRPSLIWQR
ncbi:MAG: hypothetical protein K6V36_01445 [Anaerolineae bacterium]|nr:hypothetical protein [Anaerolineae bacterium]